jgi:hypothetical protein
VDLEIMYDNFTKSEKFKYYLIYKKNDDIRRIMYSFTNTILPLYKKCLQLTVKYITDADVRKLKIFFFSEGERKYLEIQTQADR